MKKEERVAICRVLLDLIKADYIIDSGEMEHYSLLCGKYSINKDDEVSANFITFAEAISTLANAEKGLKMDFLGDCSEMTISDGFCARSEALLLIALRYILCCDDNDVQVISIPQPIFNVSEGTILYIESREESINEVIRNNYRSIFKECQVAGFNFIYIPKVIEHYRSTEEDLIRKIIKFLAPSFTNEGVDTAIHGLLAMDSSVFCKDILCNKLGIKEFRNTSPAFIIKIGRSFVGDDVYANYLKLDIDDSLMHTLQLFLDSFLSMLSSDTISVSTAEEKRNQFMYSGFYKLLLDIFLLRKNIRSRLVIKPFTEMIYFPEVDQKLDKIHRREKALYLLILILSHEGGINFSLPKSAKQIQSYNKRMDLLQKRYQTVYSLFGGESDKAPDLRVPEIRRPIVSCLKRSLANLKGMLYNADDYLILKDEFGNIKVDLDMDLQFIQIVDKQNIPLVESDIYKKILAMT